jgi:hypothetical protein
MLYTLFVLFTGIYLGQEFAIIPSVRIIMGNAMIYLRGLPDPDGENARRVVEHAGWLRIIRGYLFW